MPHTQYDHPQVRGTYIHVHTYVCTYYHYLLQLLTVLSVEGENRGALYYVDSREYCNVMNYL